MPINKGVSYIAVNIVPIENIHNWIIGPATNAIHFLGDEMKYAGNVKRGLGAIQNIKPFYLITRDYLLKHNQPTEELDGLISETPSLEEDGKKLAANDFAIVHNHSAVNMWSSIEACVADTVSLILEHDSESLDKIRQSGLRAHKRYNWPLTTIERSKLFSSLLVQSRQERNVGQAYQHILSIFGVVVGCSREEANILAELSASRNCILHNSGIVDERAVSASEYMQTKLGTRLEISSSKFIEFFDASSSFALSLLDAAVKSEYFKVRNEMRGN